MHRVLQCIDGRFPISTSILEFGTMRLNSFCAIRLFVVDTVVRHVVVESVWIRNNDINQPLQIVEEAG